MSFCRGSKVSTGPGGSCVGEGVIQQRDLCCKTLGTMVSPGRSVLPMGRVLMEETNMENRHKDVSSRMNRWASRNTSGHLVQALESDVADGFEH